MQSLIPTNKVKCEKKIIWKLSKVKFVQMQELVSLNNRKAANCNKINKNKVMHAAAYKRLPSATSKQHFFLSIKFN